jgi:hypothetical protein
MKHEFIFLIAFAILLAGCQNKIESDTVQSLEQKIVDLRDSIASLKLEAPKMKYDFNKVEALTFLNPHEIYRNDSLSLIAGMFAYDTTALTKINYWIDDSTMTEQPIRYEGYGPFLNIGKKDVKDLFPAAFELGSHKIYGHTWVMENGYNKWKYWETEYKIK